MEEYKEKTQEYDDQGAFRSNHEVTKITKSTSYHVELVNMTVTIVMAIIAIFLCSMIAIGAIGVILGMAKNNNPIERTK